MSPNFLSIFGSQVIGKVDVEKNLIIEKALAPENEEIGDKYF